MGVPDPAYPLALASNRSRKAYGFLILRSNEIVPQRSQTDAHAERCPPRLANHHGSPISGAWSDGCDSTAGILPLSVRLLFVATDVSRGPRPASANAPSRTRREALRGSLHSRAGHFAGPCRRQPIGVTCPLTRASQNFRRVCARTQLAVFVSIP